MKASDWEQRSNSFCPCPSASLLWVLEQTKVSFMAAVLLQLEGKAGRVVQGLTWLTSDAAPASHLLSITTLFKQHEHTTQSSEAGLCAAQSPGSPAMTFKRRSCCTASEQWGKPLQWEYCCQGEKQLHYMLLPSNKHNGLFVGLSHFAQVAIDLNCFSRVNWLTSLHCQVADTQDKKKCHDAPRQSLREL